MKEITEHSYGNFRHLQTNYSSELIIFICFQLASGEEEKETSRGTKEEGSSWKVRHAADVEW